MATRTHLRSRVFTITACYAGMLVAVAFLLTFRAREAQQRAERLVSVDLRAVSVLGEVVRNQHGFHSRWTRLAAESPEELPTFANRYSIVMQILDLNGLDRLDVISIHRKMRIYGELEQTLAKQWRDLTPKQKASVTRRLDEQSLSITREAESLLRHHSAEAARELPTLERQARDMMWVAIAIAYIIGILSFAIARLTLAKVVSPLERLSRAAEQIAAGDLSARAPVGGDREIARLGESFNRMADALSRSHGELRERARTDELTGLPNFRAFRETLDAEIGRSERYGYEFGILVLDLDHFKKYNDRFGHLAGNEALSWVAATIRSSLRAVDSPARYGGEEFATILPQIDPIEVRAIAERIRIGIQDLPVPRGRVPITVSIGAAIYPLDGITPEELFAAADKRLYEAKEGGRNRVIVPARNGLALHAGAS